jgi:hypothetical protein
MKDHVFSMGNLPRLERLFRKTLYDPSTYAYIQGVSGGIVNILGGCIIDYSE